MHIAIDYEESDDDGYYYAFYKNGKKVHTGRTFDIDNLCSLVEELTNSKVQVIETAKLCSWIMKHQSGDFPEYVGEIY